MIDVTRPLARHLARATFEALPRAVRHEAARAVVNWLACTVGGCRETVVDRALATVRDFAGREQACVIGRGERLDVVNAALVNTVSNFAQAFNDTHLASVAHPSGPVGAALFALAERQKVSGAAFLLAMVQGMEVTCRVGLMLKAPPAQCHDGLSTLGFTSAVGVAAAAGKLLGLDEQQLVWALGLGAVQAAGVRAGQGSMAQKLVSGAAARNGLTAALLAARDFTCAEHAIEGTNGLADVFACPANPAALAAGLGERYEFMDNAYKPYPCGVYINPVIDACLELAARDDIDVRGIAVLRARVHPVVVQQMNRPDPPDQQAALLSTQHWAAVALLRRAAGPAQAGEDVVQDDAVAALRRRVRLDADEAIGLESAIVTAEFTGGRSVAVDVAHCRGSAARPMTDAELEQKFRDQAQGILPLATVAAMTGAVWNLAACDDVGALVSRHLQGAI